MSALDAKWLEASVSSTTGISHKQLLCEVVSGASDKQNSAGKRGHYDERVSGANDFVITGYYA